MKRSVVLPGMVQDPMCSPEDTGPQDRRGPPCVRTPDVRDVVLALLAARSPQATVCPSEVARALTAGVAGVDWREAMPLVHLGVDRLLAEGLIQLSWKGKPLAMRSGPYRIGRGEVG